MPHGHGFENLRAFGRALTVAAVALTAPLSAWAAGELRVGLETDVSGFDAVEGGVLGQTGEIVMRTLQEPLVRYDPDSREYSPLLATEWELDDSGTRWTFRLRGDIRFHDGSPLTAQDVAAHYNRILDPAQKSRSRSFIDAIAGAEAVDATTVVFTLKHPWLGFMPYMATTSMSGPIPSRANVEAGKQNRSPLGSGPFRFVEWTPGDRIVVEKNPDYHDAASVSLDRIVFKVLPDTQTRFAALKSGEVDVIWTDRGQTIRQAEKDGDLVSLQRAGAGAETILLNARSGPLADLRVRQAIAHAFNQPAVVKIIWQDTKPVAVDALGDIADCGDAGYLGYDPAKAKALLADYGQPVSLTMVHTATPRGREIGTLMQQMLKAVGIALELVPVDQTTLITRTFKREFDIVGWRMSDSPDMGPQLYALVRSDSSYNLSGHATPELDEMAQAMRTATTMEERLSLQCAISTEINQAASQLYWGGGRFYAFTSKKVKGVPPPYRGAVDVTRARID